MPIRESQIYRGHDVRLRAGSKTPGRAPAARAPARGPAPGFRTYLPSRRTKPVRRRTARPPTARPRTKPHELARTRTNSHEFARVSQGAFSRQPLSLRALTHSSERRVLLRAVFLIVLPFSKPTGCVPWVRTVGVPSARAAGAFPVRSPCAHALRACRVRAVRAYQAPQAPAPSRNPVAVPVCLLTFPPPLRGGGGCLERFPRVPFACPSTSSGQAANSTRGNIPSALRAETASRGNVSRAPCSRVRVAGSRLRQGLGGQVLPAQRRLSAAETAAALAGRMPATREGAGRPDRPRHNVPPYKGPVAGSVRPNASSGGGPGRATSGRAGGKKISEFPSTTGVRLSN